MKTARLTAGLIGAVAALAALPVNSAGAATPAATTTLHAPTVAAALPAGCTANDFRVVNSPDGSYHGYIQATCSGKPKLFYISRNPQGTWALRATTIDMPIVLGLAVDNTGTYIVGKRSNHNLVLVRRNGNGSLSGVHVLDTSTSVLHPVRGVSVTASNGQYWVVWDHTGGTPLDESRTMAPALAPTAITTTPAMYAPALVAGPGAARLYACRLTGDTPNEKNTNVASLTEGTHGFIDDKDDFQGCSGGDDQGSLLGLRASYLDGHTYLVDQAQGAVDSDVSGKLAPTAVAQDAVAALLVSGGRVTAVTDNGRQPEAFVQNSDGSFPATPTSAISPAPVPVHQSQYVNRSGKLIRLLVQADSKGGPGTRLLEQLQN
ncbi:MAG TPA: hypothetical protein VHX59_10675 [Mycobacteriales bacterium]|nr:hypothetical protein [Mycobacteriales bacterium]